MSPGVISIAGLALQLLWIVYWFGFFNGGYKEFKDRVAKSLERLEGVFFKDVKVVAGFAKRAQKDQPVAGKHGD